MANPSTIGDVINAQISASSGQALAASAAAVADSALAAANVALASANSTLAGDLADVGPVFTIDTTQTPPLVTVYFPDSSTTGFHTIVPVSTSTPLPTPAPTPAPAPTS